MLGHTLAHYRILEKIGAGAVGEVYRAEDTKLKRNVAIKVLSRPFTRDPHRLARFEREAQLLASLNHPNIGAIYGLEEQGDVRFLVLELVEGETLAQRIARGRLGREEALEVGRQISAGLEAAHGKGVIHRDLKPANVMITSEGTVKVLDFGLAKALEQDLASPDGSDSPTLSGGTTRAGTILGTAAYMSPEQARGRPVDERTDIWSLGCVLYETLTGQRAFQGDTATDTLAAVLKSEPDWDRLLSADPVVRFMLEGCLKKDLGNRFHRMTDVRIGIEHAQSRGLREAEQLPKTAPSSSWRPVMHWALLGVMTLLAAAGWARIRLDDAAPESATMRFAIAPPPHLTFHRDGWSVLSPDGKQLVLSASDELGVRRLWLRIMDSLSVRELSATEGARFPFWSPDSRSIGFFADGKLKTIPASGGPALTLAEAPGAEGGTWNRDGVILFQPENSGPLHRISAAGGQSSAVTALDASRLEAGHEFPHFLPDGRHFLYFSYSDQAENTGIYLGSLAGGTSRLLVNERSTAVYAPPGYLLFGRGETLMAQPFDLDQLQVTGQASLLAEDIGRWDFWSYFSVSDTDVLVYRSPSRNHRLGWWDRGGRRLDWLGDPGPYYQIALSPDEQRVVVDVGDDELWLLELGSEVFSRFTFHPDSDADAVWSPDSREVLFASGRNGTADLFHKSLAGGDERALLESKESRFPEDWSADGRFVVFISLQGKAVYSLDLHQTDPEPKLLLETPFQKDEFRISPDRQWIAYNSNESGRWEVYVASFPDFTLKRQVSNSGGCQPQWRKDGKELFYLRMDGRLMSVEVRSGSPLQTGVPQALFHTGIAVSPIWNQYGVTADGQRFLILGPAENEPIKVILNWSRELRHLAPASN